MTSEKKRGIPIIGFITHRIKLLAKSKLLSRESLDHLLEKKKKEEKKDSLNLNLLGVIGVSKPENIIGHILLWYRIPLIIGVALSLICGYYFENYVRFIDYLEMNLLFRIIFFMIGLSFIALIVAFVALLRTFDEEYDIVGDGKCLLNASELAEVANALAWSQAQPEVEDANWVQHLLDQIWSNVNIFIIRLISNFCPNLSLEPIIGPINRLANLEISKLYLGENVPKITGIHVLNRGVKREDLIIDCEFTYDSDLEIEIKGKYHIDLGIKWVYFKAKTRILLTPLFRELPVVGNVQISFLESPKIDWEFTGLLTVLNWDVLKSGVQCVVSYFFQNPHYFAINLAKLVPKREMKLREPIGLLRVSNLSAKFLYRTDAPKAFICLPRCAKQLDPYCKVEVEEQEMKTNIIRNDSNPEWSQEFVFLVHNSIVNSIVMSVFDEDLIADEMIGRFSIPIKEFVDNKELNGREVTVPLTRANQRPQPLGHKTPRLSFRVSWFELSRDVSHLEGNLQPARAQLPVAALSVLIDSASGLDTCTSQVRSPELRPMARICVGNQERYTTCKRRTGCPVWEESHHFILYNPLWETIHIDVVDMYWAEEKQLIPFVPINASSFGTIADRIGLLDKGTVLGTYDMPTNDILNAHKMKIEGSYRLNGFVENGFIRLLTAIRIAEFNPQIAENVRKPRVLLTEVEKEIKQRIAKQKSEEKVVPKPTEIPNLKAKVKSEEKSKELLRVIKDHKIKKE